MKVKFILWSLVGAMALSACSTENDPLGGSPGGNSEGRFMAVEISNPAMLSRAGGDQTPGKNEGSYEDGGMYEEGYETENKVNSVRFYFFDNQGNAVSVNANGTGTNYVDATPGVGDPSIDMPNIEKKLKAVVVLSTKDGNTINVNNMVAVANHENSGLDEGSLSFNQLCEKVANYSDTKNGFLMTSSSYADASNMICMTPITADNLRKTEGDAEDHPVTIYIERVLAKVRLSAKWNENITKVNNVTYNEKTYTAVALKDKDGKAIQNDGKQVYAIFTGWNITGTANLSYLFKKVNNTSKWTFGSDWVGYKGWNHPGFYRSYWAMNPMEGIKATSEETQGTSWKLQYCTYADITTSVLATADKTKALYCMENAADNFEDGHKSSYDPDKQLSNRTQAIFAAVLVTIDENNVAKPLDLAIWGAGTFTLDGVKTAMFNQVSGIYTKGADDVLIPITINDVVLATAQTAGAADEKSENSPRYLSFLQLKADATGSFYNAAGEALGVDGANNILKKVPGAKVWKSGMTYYYTDIQHLGTGDETGKYGVVRNHIYELELNSVAGLGTPVLDPKEPIIPQHPGDDYTYIAAQINVLSWRVVNQGVDLVW